MQISRDRGFVPITHKQEMVCGGKNDDIIDGSYARQQSEEPWRHAAKDRGGPPRGQPAGMGLARLVLPPKGRAIHSNYNISKAEPMDYMLYLHPYGSSRTTPG